MKRKLLSILLTVVLSAALLVPAAAEDAPAVTRAGWISQLVQTFGLTVENENYPDNYYSDLTSDRSDYHDILTAVEFGLVDLDLGEAFRPDEAATREFAAQTLNYCLGYQLDADAEYTFSEAVDMLTYPADLQIALNRGWFQLVNGEVLPAQPLTAAEQTAMLADAKAVLQASEIDADYQSVYSFKDDILVISEGCAVQKNADGSISIVNSPYQISVGSKVAVYFSEIPIVYQVDTVTTTDNICSFVGTELPLGETLSDVDAQGIMEADLLDFVPAEGISVTYIFEDDTQTTSREVAQRGNKKLKTLYLNGTVNLGDFAVTLNGALSQMQVNYSVEKPFSGSIEAYFSLSGNVAFNAFVSTGTVGGSVGVGTQVIPGVGSIGVSVNLDGSASAVASYAGIFEIGFGYDKYSGFRRISNYSTTAFTADCMLKTTLSLRLAASVNLLNLGVVKGSVFETVGAQINIRHTERAPETPSHCDHIKSWLFLNYGSSLSIGYGSHAKSFGDTIEIFNEKNSPAIYVCHYEDGERVSSCTYGDHGSYYSSGTSRFGYGCSGYGSSKGFNGAGEEIKIFEYSLDDDNNATITKFSGNVATLSIPETLDGYTVTAIGAKAFRENKYLQCIKLPDTVTFIDGGAFARCVNLSSVTLSKSLTRMDAHAFYDCDALTEITIPKNLKETGDEYIYEYAYGYVYGPFYACSNLKNIIIEDGSTVIAKGLCANCDGLESITIPDTVTSINESAFANCNSLASVSLSSNLLSIGYNAFAKCSNITSIVIPDTVTFIDGGAFAKCTKLSSVTLSKSLTRMDAHAFYDCDALTEITIPKNLKETGDEYIYEYAYGYVYGPFYACSNLKNIIIEDGSTVIAKGLCANCDGLESIIIPDTVTIIGKQSFKGCGNLKEVSLPALLIEIGEYAFNETGLKSISIPNSVTGMGTSVFKDCAELEEATFTSGMTYIPDYTFQRCNMLKSIVLPDPVTFVDRYAFDGCTNLSAVEWSDKLKSINSYAFQNCAIAELNIPETVTTVGKYAFINCDALTRVFVPDSVTSLGIYVFQDCDALTDVSLGSGITEIPTSAFEHCDSLAKITIPRRVTKIGDTAFKDCVKFVEIHIPRSVTTISSTAFSYLDKLTIYGVSGTYAETFANENGVTFVSEDVAAETVTLAPATLTLLKGKSAQLTLTIAPAGCTDAVSWKSGDTAVATVDDTGLVKAVGVGSTNIKVVVGSKSATCKVTVGQPVTGISLNKTSLTLNALDTYQLNATVTPANADDPSVVWSSSNETIATVSDTGLVTALGKGSATITVKANDGSGVSKTCTVTVSNTAHMAATVEELESPHNYPDSCSDFWVYTKPGAESLRVTFDEKTIIEDGFDYLYLYDGNGNQIGKYTGKELAGKTIEIPGDTVRIQLVSDESGNEWGFKVTSVTTTGETLPGDLNGDGELTSADLVLLSKALIGAVQLTDTQKTAADLNGDGTITSADVVLLAKKLLP